MDTLKIGDSPLLKYSDDLKECVPDFAETIYRIVNSLNEKAAQILLCEFPEVIEEKNREKCEYGFCSATNQYSFWASGEKVAEWFIEFTGRNITLYGPTFLATHDYVLELLNEVR